MPRAAQTGRQRVGIDPVDRCFASGIDRRDDDHVGVVERGLEVGHQVAEPGEAVRLDDGDDAAPGPDAGPLPRGGQDGADLDRVVAIVIDDGDAPAGKHDLTDAGEAPLDAAEAREPGRDRGVVDPEFDRDGDGGKGVLDVVPPRHRQHQRLDPALGSRAVANDCGKAVAARHRRHVLAAHVGLRRKAVGDDPPVLHLGQQRLHLGMIEAQNAGAVERNVLDELDECRADAVEVAIMIEVFGVDVGDDADRPAQT